MEAKHYQETRDRLKRDPIVLNMAVELNQGAEAAPIREAFLSEFYHEDGTPTAWFMNAANAEYQKRGGKDGGHLGAIAEAMWILIKAVENTPPVASEGGDA